MPGLYPDLSYYARIIPRSLLPSPQGLPKRQRRRSRGGRCATMRLCSWTLAWRNDLSILLKVNSPLNNVELDIPCLRLGEDGKWLGVLKEVVLNIRKLLLRIPRSVKTLISSICPVIHPSIRPIIHLSVKTLISSICNVVHPSFHPSVLSRSVYSDRKWLTLPGGPVTCSISSISLSCSSFLLSIRKSLWKKTGKKENMFMMEK